MSSHKLENHLDRIGEIAAGESDVLRFGEILESMEAVSFGSLLLLAGLVTLAPLVGDIPGVPTTMGVLVLLTSGQLLVGRKTLWLPEWMRQRSVKASRVEKVLKWLRPVARTVDRVLRPRLDVLVRGAGTHVIAILSLLVGAVMPVMEFIPFSANLAGVVLTTFGLALAVRDGLLVLIMFLLIAAVAGFVAWRLWMT